MDIKTRLSSLRRRMQEHNLDYYFISNSDPHQNEYLPAAWQRYQYISGFSGSNAEVLVGREHAYFWTDGRYAEQAKLQVPATLFDIFIYAQGSTSSLRQFLGQIQNARIGVDPHTLTLQQTRALSTAAESNGNTLVFINENLIDSIWEDQPLLKHEKISVLSEHYTGESAQSKLKRLRDFLSAHHQEAIIINELPSIAWLFNLRGKDTLHNPVFLSYALITLTGGILFINTAAVPQKVADHLKSLNIEIADYTHFYNSIAKYCSKRVLLDAGTVNQAIYKALNAQEISVETSPIPLWKACKNLTEIQGAIKAHRLDALALIRFFSWLSEHQTGQTEISASEKLLEFRKLSKSFQDTSFGTIAGYGPHGAIIHYHASSESNTLINKDALFLLDSGGQYLEGTTDVTRTIHLGKPTILEKQCYTRVLKGHLALKRAIFPQGTRGEQLDILARQFLWREGLNYAHGTGHGVGAFLCVHEGPQRISTATTTAALEIGMILSNEPGVYLPGRFGIRIENLVYVKKADVKDQGFGPFYTFENLTLVPYARNLIDQSLLTETEINEINTYHSRILEELGSSLEVSALKWLIEATRPL